MPTFVGDRCALESDEESVWACKEVVSLWREMERGKPLGTGSWLGWTIEDFLDDFNWAMEALFFSLVLLTAHIFYELLPKINDFL